MKEGDGFEGVSWEYGVNEKENLQKYEGFFGMHWMCLGGGGVVGC